MLHAEMLSGHQTTLADGADETINMVDMLARKHYEFVSRHRTKTSTA